jgi:pimeloyl-ACP methyl ester carboxylesterase
MRALIAICAAAAALSPVSLNAQGTHKTYVIVHGAWGGGWHWRAVDSLLTRKGHRVVRVTLTGLGERVRLASPLIDLDTHILDVVNTILWEDLHDVILVGHSYGGMVITGVADRIPGRIRRLVYVDAFLPDSGESLHSLLNGPTLAWVDSTLRAGMSIPDWVTDTTAIPRAVPQPLRTFTDTLLLRNPARRQVPGTYILTFEPNALPDDFQPFADRAAARGWPVERLLADHNPPKTARMPLVALLAAVP